MNRVCVVYHGIADIYGHWPFKIVLFIKIMGNLWCSKSQSEFHPPVLISESYQAIITLNILLKNLEWVDEMFDAEKHMRFPNTSKNRELFQNFVKKINDKLKRNA